MTRGKGTTTVPTFCTHRRPPKPFISTPLIFHRSPSSSFFVFLLRSSKLSFVFKQIKIFMDNFRVEELQVSGLNGETPHEVDPPPPSELGSQAPTETMSTEWTDEKHSMYLKSMEASFVNQLYNSMDSRGRHTHKGNLSHIKSSKQPQFNSRAASGQFKVLRAGCWQKINFGRGEAESDCGELLANPWILHFRSTSKPKDVESPVVQEQAGAIYEEVDSSSKKEITSAPATCLKQSNHFNVSLSHMMHQDMVGGNTEVSDQNFADEDIKEEKAIASCNSKRMKNLVLQASSNDQVVPYQKPADTEDR